MPVYCSFRLEEYGHDHAPKIKNSFEVKYEVFGFLGVKQRVSDGKFVAFRAPLVH
jgi:hypothetical protein